MGLTTNLASASALHYTPWQQVEASTWKWKIKPENDNSNFFVKTVKSGFEQRFLSEYWPNAESQRKRGQGGIWGSSRHKALKNMFKISQVLSFRISLLFKVFMLSLHPSHVRQTGFEEVWNIQRFSNEEKSKIKGFQTNFPKQGGCFVKWRGGNKTEDVWSQNSFWLLWILPLKLTVWKCYALMIAQIMLMWSINNIV